MLTFPAVRATFRFLTAVALVFFCQGSARAQKTINVPADEPTIQAGINAAQNGDTVLVAPGTYEENINFEGKAITVTSGAQTYTAAASTIIEGASSGPVVRLTSGEPAGAVLNGFTVQGGYTVGDDYAAGVAIGESSDPTISNNIIQQNTGCGIVIDTGASAVISGNDIRQNHPPSSSQNNLKLTCHYTADAGSGVAIVEAGPVTLIGNIIEHNTISNDLGQSNGNVDDGGGVYLLLSGKLILRNNIICDNQGDGDDGLSTEAEGDVVLIQNLFYDDSDASPQSNAAIYLDAAGEPGTTLTEINNTIDAFQETSIYGTGSTIENNIFYFTEESDNSSLCLSVEGAVFNNNDIYSPGEPPPGNCPVGTGNLFSDPQFIDSSSGNLHTERTSPVVAAGDINAPMIPATDLDGKNRTVCGTIDMGVYEVHPKPPIVVSGTPNPSVGGSSVTFTAQLTGNCNVPTGTVTFMDGTNVLGTGTLNSAAVAMYSTSSLTVGTHTITVTYPGDFNFARNASPPYTQVVTGYPTMTSLSVSPNPAKAFTPITLSSTVTSHFGTPTGTVTFTASGQTLATAPLNAAGTATTTISTLGAGTYNIVATYSADVNFAASTSANDTEVVTGADSMTSLTASPNPADLLQTVTFSIAVKAAQGTAVPTGSVTLTDENSPLGTVPLNADGSATFTSGTLAVGSHTITATYGGSGNFGASSASVVEVITAIPSSTGLTASPNPAAVGETVTLTATAISAPAQVSSGSITFYDGAASLATVQVNTSGIATYSTKTLAIGTHDLTAVYTGSGTFGTSTSPIYQETIQPSAFTISLNPSTITLQGGQQGSTTIQLASVGLFAGQLTLSYGALPTYGTASLTPTEVTLSAGGTGSSKLQFSTFVRAASLGRSPGPHAASLILSAGAILLLLPLGSVRRKRWLGMMSLGLALVVVCSMTGCTNIYYVSNLVAPGNYQIPITATDAQGNSQTAMLTLVVTQ